MPKHQENQSENIWKKRTCPGHHTPLGENPSGSTSKENIFALIILTKTETRNKKSMNYRGNRKKEVPRIDAASAMEREKYLEISSKESFLLDGGGAATADAEALPPGCSW